MKREIRVGEADEERGVVSGSAEDFAQLCELSVAVDTGERREAGTLEDFGVRAVGDDRRWDVEDTSEVFSVKGI